MASRPQQNFSAHCVLAAQAAVQMAKVQQGLQHDAQPVRAFSQMLAEVGRHYPRSLSPRDQEILWALPRAMRNDSAGASHYELANTALAWSLRLEGAIKRELPAQDLNDAKFFCLRMSDALGRGVQKLEV